MRNSWRRRGFACALSALVLSLSPGAVLADDNPLAELDSILPALRTLYIDLHQNPELSLQEVKTAAKLAARMRELGYEVSEGIGGHGIVAVLRNGDGPTLMLRTDMDALPIEEQTQLPYASRARAQSAEGESVPLMHACGHDAHMAAWIGAATLLARSQANWSGTLVFIGQPAEEVLQGAKLMLAAGVLTRFPRPDFILGVHVTHVIAAGQVGLVAGPASAASNGVDITFFGKGGHGAAPQMAIDPILMASRAVVALQGIVAREVDPLQAAVITVGSFHAGSKRNIIPEQAQLKLTVRSFAPAVQQHLLQAIERVAKGEAIVSGAPREPIVAIDPLEASEVVINDPLLAVRLGAALRAELGDANVVSMQPFSSSEDFGDFGRAEKIPSIQLRIGASEAEALRLAKEKGSLPPGVHNAGFAPDLEPTLRTGVAAFTLSALALLAPNAEP